MAARRCAAGPYGCAMQVLRTPEERFSELPDFPCEPHYCDVGVRMHFVDEGAREAAPVLLLHGEPSWSFLYRHVIAVLGAAGHRVVAPDLIGFGRSDKPARREDHTYARHVEWITRFVESLDLRDITLVCQDWGGLIGLRVATDHDDRFAGIVAANTGLPTGDEHVPSAFHAWRRFSQTVEPFAVGNIVAGGCSTALADETLAAYDAPFPDESFKAGPRQMPLLVPVTPDDPAAPANREAWTRLRAWRKPFLCAFSDGDPITRGADRRFREAIPGCAGQAHTTIAGAGHFLQEDRGEELGRVIVGFIAASVVPAAG
jgi:haloalkane dehalogenase